MKKVLFVILTALTLMPMTLFAQTYNNMWKLVEDAQQKDLPATAISHLQKIEARAARERAYGHLLKAALLHARLQAEIAPDSLARAVGRLEQLESNAQDAALKAVYDAVLSKVYENNRQLADNWQQRRDDYRQRALSLPGVLAQVKAADYVPLVIKGKDSEVFGDDLLSVIGMELDAWDTLEQYYRQTANRRALCQLSMREATELRQIDSLLAVYGDLPEAATLKKKRQNLWTLKTNPTFSVEIPVSVQEVNKPQIVKLNQLRHLERLSMKVYRTRLTGDTQLNPSDEDDYKRMKSGLTPLPDYTRTLTFSGHADDEIFTDSLQLAGMPAGVYLLEWTTDPVTDTQRMLYFVSGLRVMMQPQPDNSMRYVVVDATSGQPVSKAALRLQFGRNKSDQLLTTDKQGEARYQMADNHQPSLVTVTTDVDKYLPQLSAYGRYSYYDRKYDVEHTQLFTDRSIYRPGQTVQVSAVVWRELSVLDNQAVADKLVTFELRDANYKLVGEQQATTDRYGKCAVQFTLPHGLLNGRFSVRTSNSSASFRVEEYKRPSFQVEFADYEQAYQAGDTLQAAGKVLTYAGVPVQDARVRYTVKRRVAFWWHFFAKEETVNEGETTTADDGTFKVTMPMVLPESQPNPTMFYHFVVDAEVTDVAGETHHGSLSLPLGNRPTALSCDLPQQVRADQLPAITFSRRNAAGTEIAGTVSYRIDGKKWQQCEANSQLSALNAQLKSGQHTLEAVCQGDTLRQQFVVFSLDDKKPVTTTADWFYVSDSQFPADGKPVILQVGSSDPDMYIVYSLFAGKQLIESGAVRRDAELENRRFNYKEEYGNGLLLTYAWVKNGVCHHHKAFIRRPLPEKQLKLSWETFRDRLTPGQHEEWRLKILNADGTPADASLLAVLYDKSLDAVNPHQWAFQPVASISQPAVSWQWRQWNSLYGWGAQNYQLLEVRDFDYSRFDSSVYPTRFFGHRLYVRGAKVANRGMVANQEMLMASKVTTDAVMAKDESIVVGYAAKGEEPKAAEDRQQEEHAAQQSLRENLQETAFCYPSLTTDAQGVATMSFTLPESLTTWRFMGIANTPAMFYGAIDAEAVAKKEVMIQPNMPRFLRQDDKAQLSARIFNTTDHAVGGNVLLQLIDPASERVVYEQQVPFQVEAGKTAGATFDVSQLPAGLSLLICRVTARGDGFADGEQHYLPLLSNREYVTRTVPFTQHEAGVKTIDIAQLFPQGTTQQKLTVEYTNNPVWLMVQSLPVLGQPLEHSAIDQAASYYSNLLAKSLLDQSPQVKTVFEQWQREASHPSSLTSHLYQNQELKDLLLQETPWVAAADRESEQRRHLADFFDENGINHRLQTAVGKLQKLQHGDGSFSWYPGMEGSLEMTVAIGEMFARLNKMVGEQADTKQMQDRAFNYMGRKVVERVAKMKQQEKKGRRQVFPSFSTLRWLYLCAIDGRKLPADVKAANNYLIALLKKEIRRQSIYEKALTAIVLAQHQEKTKAAEYVRSLKEYTVYTEEMGRYYDTPRAGYSWYDYRIPTEVAALEAIQTVTPGDRQTVAEMRRWLLQEKRTQAWGTPINSVNAIYAFLQGERQQLTTDAPAAALAIDGTPVETSSATAGIGYVKTALANPQGRILTAAKTSPGTSWGAVYAQFMQPTADIEASQSGISITREVLPLTSGSSPLTSLHVGDRIRVRLTIHTTRDLDFVQVVDRRAACMEPVQQLSGYRQGAYVSPKDCATHYFYYGLAKGKHVIETEYYIDRAGRYETGTCTAGCAYAPEYRATAPSVILNVTE